MLQRPPYCPGSDKADENTIEYQLTSDDPFVHKPQLDGAIRMEHLELVSQPAQPTYPVHNRMNFIIYDVL